MHKPKFQVGELFAVEIEKLTFGGNGLARHEGIVFFVPFSAPGDQLQVRISEVHKNYYFAEIESILKPSPFRENSKCLVFGKCGGCDWQHLAYDVQLKQKFQIVREQILSSGNSDFELLPIVPSPKQTHYRNRVQLKFDGKSLGFYARKSHEVVSTESCVLMEDSLFRRHLSLADELRKTRAAPSNKIEISLNSEGFSQVNQDINELLQTELISWASEYEFHHFLDLYAGNGNFTFPLLNHFKKLNITAVEMNALSVQKARKTIKSSQNVQFFLSSVDLYLRRRRIEKRSLVLIDPPRVGCSDFVIKSLAESEGLAIFYISCDPARLSRDLKLFAKLGWRVRRARLFDMFPQTHHIETLLELIR